MSKYTAEQARSSLQKMHGHPLTVAERAELFSMASNYADLLRERESAKACVTDEMIECAARAMQRKFDPSSSLEDMTANGKWRRFVDEAKCCLEAVAPMLASARVLDGYMLVPEMFGIPADAWRAAQFAFGGPGTGDDEPFMDCTAWIGELTGDEGEKIQGLHVWCDECPEEGSITLAEFPATPNGSEVTAACAPPFEAVAPMLASVRVPDGWLPIESAPNDGTMHVRGLMVHGNDGKALYWDACAGHLDTEDGKFIDQGGNDFGWNADDFTHWHPLAAATKPEKED